MGHFWIHRSKTQVVVSLFLILLCLQSRRYNVAVVFLSSKISLSVSSRYATFEESSTLFFFWNFVFLLSYILSRQSTVSKQKTSSKSFFINLSIWTIICVFYQFFFYETCFDFLKDIFNIYSKTKFGSLFWTFLFFHPFLFLSLFYTIFNKFWIKTLTKISIFLNPILEFVTSMLFNTFFLTGTCWRKRSSRFYKNLFYEVPKIEFLNEKKVTK